MSNAPGKLVSFSRPKVGYFSNRPRMFSGNSVSAKKLYLLYDEKDKHYNVITNLKAAMAKKYTICRNCSYLVTSDNKHECFKKFCNYCSKNQPSGHFCYVAPLKPSKLSDRFLYIFFDTECTQDLERHDGSLVHVPNLICAQQMCSKCEAVDDMNVDC